MHRHRTFGITKNLFYHGEGGFIGMGASPTGQTQLDILVERFLQRAGTLYSLPAVAVKVLQLADDPQLDTPRLKECIENDPALTSRILRVVNSSLFGLSAPVADLGQALTLLGVKPLKLLVLGFSLPEGLYAGVSAEVLRWYWRRTLTKAVSARQLCQTLWRKPGDDAFLIGLLQDLGMLLLIQSVGSAYQDFVQRVRSMGKDLIGLERQVMGFDHTALTARLLKHWRLPEAIVQWISWEEIDQRLQASGGQPPVLAQVIHLAEGLARVLADRQPESLNEVLRAGAQYRGLTHSQLEQIVADLESKVAQLAEVLHLDLPPTEDYRAILLEAHRRLSEAAAEVVQSLLRRKSSARPAEETPEPLQPHVAQLAEAIERLSMPMGKGQKSALVAASAREKEEAESERSRISEKGEQKSPSSAAALAEMLVPDVAGPGKSPPGADSAGRTTTPGKTAFRSSPAATSRDSLRGSGRLDKSASGARPTATISPALSDPGLLGHLKVTVAACRNARAPVSLLLAEPVEQEDLLLQLGPEGMQRFQRLLQKAAESLGHDGSILLPYGDWGVAVVLPDCDRQEAVRLGNQLMAAMRQVSWGGVWNSRGGVALGVGVASVDMPPKNFPAEDLLEAAARCLFGSHSCGGGVVKSIEIY
jgi:HD-like signal output (HDOD) protein